MLFDRVKVCMPYLPMVAASVRCHELAKGLSQAHEDSFEATNDGSEGLGFQRCFELVPAQQTVESYAKRF